MRRLRPRAQGRIEGLPASRPATSEPTPLRLAHDPSGLVFANGHNIQPDVPVENVLAMYEHARAYVPSYVRTAS